MLIVAIIASIASYSLCSRPFGTGWGYTGWHDHGMAHGRFHSADASKHSEWVVDRAMNDVQATDAQKAKARAIVDAAANDLQEFAALHRKNHQALVAILKEPTLDRAKLETLRVDATRGLEASSQRITKAIGDLAEILTPDQRRQLAEHIEKMHGS